MKVAQMELKMTLMGHKLSHCNSFPRETVGNVWRDLIIRTVGGFEGHYRHPEGKGQGCGYRSDAAHDKPQRILWPQMLIVAK